MQQNLKEYFYSPEVSMHTSSLNKTDPETLEYVSEIF